MSSPPVLEFEELTAPIPGDTPAGESLPFSVKQKLEEDRKEVDPAAFAEDDPLRPAEPKYADWNGIVDLAKETLTATSKDLLVAARLTEALAKLHGFAGARDGLHLLRLLVEQCWDRLNPTIEDGDVEVRATAFNWLDDPDRGARFPSSLRMVPLVHGDGEGYGWHHWKLLQDGRGSLTAEVFDRAVEATPREDCQRVVEDLTAAVAEARQLTEALTEKMEALAPSMLGVQKALGDSLTLAQQVLHRKGPPPEEEAAAEPTAEETAPGAAPAEGGEAAPAPREKAAARPLRTRADAYRQLAEAAALLQQLEPHSPIPYLIQRAVALGAMPFPKLMRELIRDENILSEMNRELGIREDAGEAAEEQVEDE
jgi:type VI secretion system protein ImpA